MHRYHDDPIVIDRDEDGIDPREKAARKGKRSQRRMDIPVYETLVCMKRENYIAAITACTYFTDDTEQILNQFRPF